ncbi:glutathione S-transferase family protein [Schauerella aestuarii]|uniref:glutathione S-transferase family protein n=1 Tax=Schauerella aestuarii TaxID=2511204 RepID=UPI001370984F|nr:glutathione S-transferase [Achromobacter aestuarii]MYZ43422.1 glutathione S-transferase [Achromobacter aestuarii]
MLVVHHLNNSRSQRILWLLEELNVPYDIKLYQRNPETQLAPPELKKISPLGKSPVVQDGDQILIESGAIIETLVRKHGGGRLAPPVDTPAFDSYIQWLHYAEGSAMLPLMLNLYVGKLKDAGAPLHPRIESEIDNHLSYIETALAKQDYLLGDELTAADIQMSFIGEIASRFGKLDKYPAIAGWVKRFQARPAYQTAVAKGGPYQYAK